MKKQFAENGFVIMRQLIEPEVVQGVRDSLTELVDRLAAKLMAEGKIHDSYPHEPFEKRLYRIVEHHLEDAPKIYRPELHLKGFYHLFFHKKLLNMAQELLGDEIRLYPNYSVRPKLPDFEAVRVLWHQDGGYTDTEGGNRGVDTLRMVNVWTPLVSATVENGCMQFVPGTHKLGVVPHIQKNEYYLEIADEHLQPHLPQAIDIELEPGDVVLFHNLLFHQGLPNHSDHIRWSLDWRYQDATQSTLRKENGHLAVSSAFPEQVVLSEEDWVNRIFE